MKVYINGIGIISPLADNIVNFWDNINKSSIEVKEEVTYIPPIIAGGKMRRMDRLSILAVYSAQNALEDSKIDIIDSYDIGTVFNSDYCHINSNLKFGQYVVDGTPDLASPSVFTNTVNNACVGHVCINLGLKGASTMLISSNYVGYGIQLLKRNKAKAIIVGGVEEYNEQVFNAIKKNGVLVSECGSALVLSGDENIKKYCQIISYHEVNLGGHPFFSKSVDVDVKDIENIIMKVLEKAKINPDDISGIITGCHIKELNENELLAINNIFKGLKPVIQPKIILGDTLGAALGVNLSIGALILKNQSIPEALLLDKLNIKQEYNYLLVNNYTLSGGFISYIIKK